MDFLSFIGFMHICLFCITIFSMINLGSHFYFHFFFVLLSEYFLQKIVTSINLLPSRKMEPIWDDEDGTSNSGNVTGTKKKDRIKRRQQLYRVSAKGPDWAKLPESDEQRASDDEQDSSAPFHATAGCFIGKSRALPAKNLKFTQWRDVTIGHQKGAITSVKFHPFKPVLVTGTAAGLVSLFEICKDNNNLEQKRGSFFLQNVQFPRFRLDNIDFFDGGMQVLTSSTKQNHCYTYDLLSGKVASLRQPVALGSLRSRLVRLSADGIFVAFLANVSDIFVFQLKTMDHLHTFRGAESVADFCFAPFDRNIIYALAVNGAVYTLDLRRRADQHCFFDHGCVRATCISCSPTGQFIACGSNTGIVNVYDLAAVASSSHTPADQFVPNPLHTFSQLTTSIAFAKFSADAQLMAFGSDVKHMAGRLAHCSSGTVFPNFPSKQEHFSRDKLTCADFSPNNAFLVLGTKPGKIRLYRLAHFETY